ncbi:hypothetical protein HY970_01980 [Candidatus Kaiserbacteria bacterium]|nr:hypothetical protein [Candidatus Kaiserbacteria bacterium]
MGTIEESGRKRKRRRDLKFALLAGVQAAALTGVLVLAPNVPQALHKLGLIERFSSKDSSTIARARRRMMKAGLLKENNGSLRLTPKGLNILTVLQSQYAFQKPATWDGRWRALIFDVPEYRKSIRDKIRRTLMRIGFIRLQDSVWVYPYDCEDLIALLKADFKIGKDVLYMIVDEMEGDKDLRKHFGLSIAR